MSDEKFIEIEDEQPSTQDQITSTVDMIAMGVNVTLQNMQLSLAQAGISPVLGLMVLEHMAGTLYRHVLPSEKERVFEEAQGNPNIPAEEKLEANAHASVDALHQSIRDYIDRVYLPLKEDEVDPNLMAPMSGDIH